MSAPIDDHAGDEPAHDEQQQTVTPPAARKGPLRLIRRTLSKAWEGNIFSESAEAAFWQTLSLPPLLLGLLGSLGFVGDWLGPDVVTAVRDQIISFSEKVFSEVAVNQIITPTVNDILTIGKGEIVSVGFVISLWAGSSAIASFVDAITVAHDQYGVRNEVWQRLLALLLYVASLALLVVGLPLLAIGPGLLPEFVPADWRPTVASWVSVLYYPTLAVLIVLALATLYKLALPRKLPWHRGLPGAGLAMVIFLLASVGLRIYLSWITTTGYTYGALAAPIAFLLLTFFIGMAVVGGAYLNSAIQELWPAGMTTRQRRKWRRLEMERASERMRAHERTTLWQRTTQPLRKPAKRDSEPNARDSEANQDTTNGEEPASARADESGNETLRLARDPAAKQRPRPQPRPRPGTESVGEAQSSPSSPPEGKPS